MPSSYKGPWEYYVRNTHIQHPSKCWEWKLSVSSTGYGNWCHAKQGTAHKRTYVLFNGDPGDLFVLHRCGNRRCCNPDHLYAGTPLENYEDAVRHGTNSPPPVLRGQEVKNQNGMSLLNPDIVRAIRRRRESGETGASLAREYGVTQSCISRVYKRKVWDWIKD